MPLSGLPHQSAKPAWLLLNLIFLGITALLLARLINGSAGVILLVTLAGYLSLDSNFLLGRYCVFLLFLLTLGVYLLLGGRLFSGKFLMGLICMLKLYSAPFLLDFPWKREWRALSGMLAARAGLAMLSIAWFGLAANMSFLNYVFARASENAILDPYHPAIGTLTNLLRRSFIMEPELNPHPLFNAPMAFFFLRPLLTLSILILPLLALRRDSAPKKRELAWFLIAILLFSPNAALYVFIVLLLPIAMLLDGANRRCAIALVGAYVLLSLPLQPGYSWLFPKAWILLALFMFGGADYWNNLRPRLVLGTLLTIAMFALGSAVRDQQNYNREPPRKFVPVELKPYSSYASHPAVSKTGIVFESMDAGRYVLNRTMAFDGHAFHPSTPAPASSVYFELVAGGRSAILSFDPQTQNRRTVISDAISPAISLDGHQLAYVSNGRLFIHRQNELLMSGPVDAASFTIHKDIRRLVNPLSGDLSEPAVSPNGRSLAFTLTRHGIRHVWMEDIATKVANEVTEGSCNSYAPAWEPDSKVLIFASDCDRGLGLPRLYRAETTAQ